MADISKYKFGKSVRKMSAGNFREFAKGRYNELKKNELDALVERYYGKDTKELEVDSEEVKADDSSRATKSAGSTSK